MKKLISVFLTAVMVLSLFTVSAFAEQSEDKPADRDYMAEEVIYGVLDAEGDTKKVLPVVVLDAKKDSSVTYYADFEAVKNLTNTDEISSENGVTKLQLPKGRFYFEGEISEVQLPWDIEISYKLDGRDISPEKLGGKSGRLEIEIEIGANEKGDRSFFDAYLMQISATLNSEKCKNIKAEGATIANAGANKMINFMSMPGTESEFLISADVENFTMGGMSIAAVPLSMADMLGSMEGISEGLDQFSDAMDQLSGGVSQLNSGAYQLADGMNQFSAGLLTLSSNSQSLRDGATMMRDALKTAGDILDAIPEGGEMPDIPGFDFAAVSQPLYALAENIRLTADRISNVQSSINSAIDTMNNALLVDLGYPDEAELSEILANYPNTGSVLYNGYITALNAQGAWAQASAGLIQANSELDIIAGEINAHADAITAAADGLSGLTAPEIPGGGSVTPDLSQLKELIAGFQMFYDGVIQYTQAVDLLADNSVAIADGVSELAGGTSQLNSGTSQIPEKMDEMMDSVAGEDFDVHSFLSEKNEAVSGVQFVFTTEGISAPDTEPVLQEEPEAKSGLELFVSKFKALFTNEEK